MLPRLLAAPRAARSHTAHSHTAALLAGLAVGAIDADTGQVRWHRDDQDLSDGFLTNLAWANGMLFMMVDKAADAKLELRVLDAITGKRLTRHFRSYPQWARVFGNSLTVADGRVQIGYYEDGQGDSTSQARWITYGLQ